MVDLAGSENIVKSGVTGAGLNEAKYINKSLLALVNYSLILESALLLKV
jgi:hypothetical protein